MAPEMTLTFTPDGRGHCLYGEAIDLQALGPLTCRRASQVEFDDAGQQWQVLTADRATVRFSSPSRQRCLDWERDNLNPAD